MVRHVILWKVKSEYTSEERTRAIFGVKEALEALLGKIPGLVSIRVVTEALPSSNADLMLDSLFESEEALAGYQSHPDHVAAANGFVRPHMETRLCLDFEEK